MDKLGAFVNSFADDITQMKEDDIFNGDEIVY